MCYYAINQIELIIICRFCHEAEIFNSERKSSLDSSLFNSLTNIWRVDLSTNKLTRLNSSSIRLHDDLKKSRSFKNESFNSIDKSVIFEFK